MSQSGRPETMKSAFRVTPSGVSYCRFITAKAVTAELIF
jgi:hypothetical protein